MPFSKRIIVRPEEGEVSDFVRKAYLVVSKAMKVKLKKFPHFIYSNKKNLRKIINKCVEKIEQSFFSYEVPFFKKKVYDTISNLVGCFYHHNGITDAGRSFSLRIIYINKDYVKKEDLGSTLGEELFHFVHEYYLNKGFFKRESDSKTKEYFGKIGSLLLYGLFNRLGKEYEGLKYYLKFFKILVNKYLKEEEIKGFDKLLSDFNELAENPIVINQQSLISDKAHSKGYQIADAHIIAYPILYLALSNPKRFFRSEPKEIEEMAHEWAKKRWGLNEFKKRRRKIIKKIKKADKKTAKKLIIREKEEHIRQLKELIKKLKRTGMGKEELSELKRLIKFLKKSAKYKKLDELLDEWNKKR